MQQPWFKTPLGQAVLAAARQRPARRSYAAAQVTNLTASWTTQPQHINSDLRQGLRALRARARELSQNNDYARKFLSMVETNVVGHAGFSLQVKPLRPDGRVDELDAATLERAFHDWSRRGNCDVTGQLSFAQLQRLFIRTVARDGECAVREVVRGRYGYQLQLIDPQQIDDTYDDPAKRIRMGVEYDETGAALAFYLTQTDPTDTTTPHLRRIRTRVPATELTLHFVPEAIGQLRGSPWMAAGMIRLNMLGAYEEAEVTAARIGAAKMGFFTDSPDGDAYMGDAVDATGNIIAEPTPGTFERLPPGVEFKAFDPQHPNSGYKDFVKACLRGLSSGLGVSYNSLANDLEGVNYSSIRAGVLEEREVWKSLQGWMIDSFLGPTYSHWLANALTTGEVPLPASKFAKFDAAKWQGRRWDWVDPLKDMEAAILAVKHGLKSRTEIVSEQGRDLADVWLDLAREQQEAAAAGVRLADLEEAVPVPAPPAPEMEDEDDAEDEMRTAVMAALTREVPQPNVVVHNTPAAVQVDVAEHPEVAARMEKAVVGAVTAAVDGLRESMQQVMADGLKVATEVMGEKMGELLSRAPAPVVHFTPPPPPSEKIIELDLGRRKIRAKVNQ